MKRMLMSVLCLVVLVGCSMNIKKSETPFFDAGFGKIVIGPPDKPWLTFDGIHMKVTQIEGSFTLFPGWPAPVASD